MFVLGHIQSSPVLTNIPLSGFQDSCPAHPFNPPVQSASYSTVSGGGRSGVGEGSSVAGRPRVGVRAVVGAPVRAAGDCVLVRGAAACVAATAALTVACTLTVGGLTATGGRGVTG